MNREKEAVLRYGRDILLSDGMRRERLFMQHGDISCYRHSVRVALCSIRLAEALHIRTDTQAMVRGALLHDYFLYDWHENDPSHKWHGFHHASRALRNAGEDFELSLRERNVIKRHMFPLNPMPPRYRESWLVCAADKWCALQETLAVRVGKRLKESGDDLFG